MDNTLETYAMRLNEVKCLLRAEYLPRSLMILPQHEEIETLTKVVCHCRQGYTGRWGEAARLEQKDLEDAALTPSWRSACACSLY